MKCHVAEANLWPHLGSVALPCMGQGPAPRLAFMKKDRWIGYPLAASILEDLDDLVDQYDPVRPSCRLIVGPADNGKTRILRHLVERHPATHMSNGSAANIPVLFIPSPNRPKEELLLATILTKLGTPVPASDNLRRLQSRLDLILPQVGLKVLLIDEFHSSIQGSKKQTHDFLQAVKKLSNDYRISIVGAGLLSAHNAIATDDQLDTRFERLWLPRWQSDTAFKGFLKSMEKVLPLECPSNLEKNGLPEVIHTLSEGRIGQVIKLLRKAAAHSIRNGKEKIDMEAIEKCGFKTLEIQRKIPPGVV